MLPLEQAFVEEIPVDLERRPLPVRTFIALGLVVSVIVGLVSLSISQSLISKKEEQTLRDIAQRLEIQAKGKADVIQTWADGILRTGSGLAGAELLRLFATEVDNASELRSLPPQLFDQIPYMRVMMDDFSRQNNMSALALINREGRAYLSSGSRPVELDDRKRVVVEDVFRTGSPVFMPLRMATNERKQETMVADVFLPITRMDEGTAGSGKVVGALLMTVESKSFDELFKVGPYVEEMEVTRLVQKTPTGYAMVLRQRDGLTLAKREMNDIGSGFDERDSVGGGGQVFSYAVSPASLPWLTVIQEVPSARALLDMSFYKRSVMGVALLVTAVVAGFFLAFVNYHFESKQRSLANQYHRLAMRINAQRQLLNSVNGAMRELISVKTPDGIFVYVNESFLRFWGKSFREVIGQRDTDVLGDAAPRMSRGDGDAMANGYFRLDAMSVKTKDGLRILEGNKMALQGPDGHAEGVVSVLADVTELTDARGKVERAMQQTMNALVRTVEIRDPHLAGHYNKVETLSVAIADVLEMSDDERLTLESASRLAGVGKVFVPMEILTKPGKLTKKEMDVMQSHIQHAMNVLGATEFDLPVKEIIYQMYERLDGSGYPNGLKGNNIHTLARVLGICDVFCALVAPRAYRNAKTVDEALAVFQEESKKFDPRIVRAVAYLMAEDNPNPVRSLFIKKTEEKPKATKATKKPR
ncbi:MAG: PAS domain-containing protein [Proteobacteria bacterium]|nr:PAS domain-containing protein [Pseudomonadota bacterium]